MRKLIFILTFIIATSLGTTSFATSPAAATSPGATTSFSPTTKPGTLNGYNITEVYVVKSERLLLLLSGQVIVKGYYIALGANPIGHKQQQGDERTPEGHYKIDYRVKNSDFFRALHISYPNKKDRARAQKMGVDPGGDIMIHGFANGYELFMPPIHFFFNWTDGCIAVSNTDMQEIWNAVRDGTPITIRP